MFNEKECVLATTCNCSAYLKKKEKKTEKDSKSIPKKQGSKIFHKTTNQLIFEKRDLEIMGQCGSKSSSTKASSATDNTTTTTAISSSHSVTSNNNDSFHAANQPKRTLSHLFPEFQPKTETDPEWEQESVNGVCPECHSHFDVFNRPHHCRSCGKLYCKTCCYKRKTLKDQKICGMCLDMAMHRLKRRELSHLDSKLKRNSELIRRNLAAKKEQQQEGTSRTTSPAKARPESSSQQQSHTAATENEAKEKVEQQSETNTSQKETRDEPKQVEVVVDGTAVEQ